MSLRSVRFHSPAHRPHCPDPCDHAGDVSGGERSGLAPPAHLLPGIAHGVFKLLPRPLLLRLPPPPGFGLEGRPVAAGIASITGELVAIAIAWGPALIALALAPAGKGG